MRWPLLSRTLLFAASAIAGFAAPAVAQETVGPAVDIREAGAEAVVRSLMLPREAAPGAPRTRSFATRNIAPHAAARPVVPDEPAQVGESDQPATHASAGPPLQPKAQHYLNIQFALGSAELDIAARDDLFLLATILKDQRLAGQAFSLGGHTDARGGDGYNLELSRRRAESVRSYLTTVLGVDGERLVTRGYGESRPLPGLDPYDAVNRRVEIANFDFATN